MRKRVEENVVDAWLKDDRGSRVRSEHLWASHRVQTSQKRKAVHRLCTRMIRSFNGGMKAQAPQCQDSEGLQWILPRSCARPFLWHKEDLKNEGECIPGR